MARHKKQIGNDALRNLDLNLLVTLDALLRLGSVTQAAEELGVSQSAVSHALAKLRAVFGDPLFIKTHNKMVATPKALTIASTVSQIVTLARSAVAPAVAFSPATAERRLTLCLDDIGELAILPQLMTALRHTAPACSVQTMPADPAQLEAALESGRADLAITGPLGDVGELMQQKLYSHTFTVIASQRSRLGARISLAQFSSMDHVAQATSVASRVSLSKALERRGITRKIRLTTPHHLMVPLLVEQDPTLIAVVPRLLADTYLKRAAIKIVAASFELPTIEVYQYWHRRFDADPFNAWLRSFIREVFYRNPALHIE